MIKFSDRQLKIPKLARPVYLVTAGQSPFDRAFPDRRTEELCIEAFTEAAGLIDKRLLGIGDLSNGLVMEAGDMFKYVLGADITLHDPGVYRGGSDPLLAKQASPEQKARLSQRFEMGQTDR